MGFILQTDEMGLNLRKQGRIYSVYKYDNPLFTDLKDGDFAQQVYNNQLRRERELRRR